MDAPAKACAECGGLLVPSKRDGSTVYEHWKGAADHEARPVPVQGERWVCDFCNQAGPVAVMFSRPFLFDAARGLDLTSAVGEREDDGAWKACQGCFYDVQGDRWDDILKRALANIPEGVGRATVENATRGVHEAFRASYEGRWVLLDLA